MARRRDYKAEYRRRVERNLERLEAAGLPKRLAYGKRRPGEPSLRELERSGRIPKLPPARPPAPPKRVNLGGQTRIIRTSSAAELLAEMRAAAAKRQRFALKVTFPTDRGPRTRRVDGSTTKSGAKRRGEEPNKPLPMAVGRRKGPRVEATFAPANAGIWRAQAGHGGLPAREFIERYELNRSAGRTPAEAVWQTVFDYWTEAGE